MASFVRRIRNFNYEKLVRLARKFWYTEMEERMYRVSAAEGLEMPESPDFGRDRWEDLFLYQSVDAREVRDEVLAEWRSRLDRGWHVFTKVEDGRLVAYGWLVDRQKISRCAGQTFELPDDCALIYNYFTLPEYRNRDYYQRMLIHAIHEGAKVPGTRWVYMGVPFDDEHKIPRWWVERLAEHCDTCFYRRRLFFRKTWRERVLA
jgi:GNAT superfamily N-acetyltransferase